MAPISAGLLFGNHLDRGVLRHGGWTCGELVLSIRACEIRDGRRADEYPPDPSISSQQDSHGDELYTIQSATFPDAALVRTLRVAGLSGETLQVTIPAGPQSGTALRLNGTGMPKVGEKGKGDLFVVVEVRTPTELSDRKRALLLELAKVQPGHEVRTTDSQLP